MNKKTLLLLRFVLILTTILVMTYSKKGLSITEPGYVVALIYFISNLLCYRIPEKTFSKHIITFLIFLFDIIAVSLAIYFTQGVQTDFYLIYFLVILIASIGQNISGSIPIALVASIVYIGLIYRANPGISLLDQAILIRIPFLFIIAILSSYWSQSMRRALKGKEQLERFTRELKKEVTRVAAKEIELRQYNEKIINSFASGVIAVQSDGIVTTLNPEASRVLGLSKDSVVGHNIKDIKGLKPLWQKMEQSIESGALLLRDEVSIRNKNNTTIPIGLSISPITGSNEMVSGCLIVFKDLSEIRVLEEKLKHAERLSYLGKMASWVAHEIRNPLTAIDGFSQLLGNTDNKGQIKLFSSEIHKGAQRINHIIEDILTFARAKRKIDYVNINLRSLMKSITKSIMDIKITMRGDKSPIIKGEIESIRRMFVNLINNSTEVMDEDGELQINFSSDEKYYITEITDNGKGITKENMKNLFTPFFTTKQRGTGLGLSIVKKIVDEHKGKVEIESEDGIGTTCRVYLQKKKA